MPRTTWRRAVLGLGMLGFMGGCGGAPKELPPPTDPPKPFPAVQSAGEKTKPAAPAFPTVK